TSCGLFQSDRFRRRKRRRRSSGDSGGTGFLADHSRCAEDEDVYYRLALRDGDVWAEVDVLNGVEQLHAFFHGALEGFTTGDEPGAAGAIVDHGRGQGFLEIVHDGGDARVASARATGEEGDD